jgi:hypothetical protein
MKKYVILGILIGMSVLYAGVAEKGRPHAAPPKIQASSPVAKASVKWVRVFGDSQRRNILVHAQPMGDDLALMYGYRIDTKGTYEKVFKIALYEYVFMVLDKKGKRKWEAIYEPDKIRFVSNFVVTKNGDIYVVGWGGKNLDVWYIERFDRHDHRGKRVARKLMKYAIPAVLLERNGGFVTLGFTLYDRKERGIVLWSVGPDGKERKTEIEEWENVPNEFLSGLIGSGKLPIYATYRKSADGGLLLHIEYETSIGSFFNIFLKLSPSFNIEETLGKKDWYCDLLEKEDKMYASVRDALKGCDHLCYHELWRVDADELGVRPCGKILYGSGRLLLASDDGNVASVRSSNGKVLWHIPFGKRRSYDVDRVKYLFGRKSARNRYVRVGYLVEKREKEEVRTIQVMDFLVR